MPLLALKKSVPRMGGAVPPEEITTFDADPTEIVRELRKICDPATAALIVPRVLVPVVIVVPQELSGKSERASTVPEFSSPTVPPSSLVIVPLAKFAMLVTAPKVPVKSEETPAA